MYSVPQMQGHTTSNPGSVSSMASGRVDEPMDTFPASASDLMTYDCRALTNCVIQTQSDLIQMQKNKLQTEDKLDLMMTEMKEMKQLMFKMGETLQKLVGTQPVTTEQGLSVSAAGMPSHLANFAQRTSSASTGLIASNNDQSNGMSTVPPTSGETGPVETNIGQGTDSLDTQIVKVIRGASAKPSKSKKRATSNISTNSPCRPFVADPNFLGTRSVVQQNAPNVPALVNLRKNPTQTTSESRVLQLDGDYYKTRLAHLLEIPSSGKAGRAVRIAFSQQQDFALRVRRDIFPVSRKINLAVVCDSDHGLHHGLFALCDENGNRLTPIVSQSMTSNDANPGEIMEIIIEKLWMHRVPHGELITNKTDRSVTYRLKTFPSGVEDYFQGTTNQYMDKQLKLNQPMLFAWFPKDSDPSQLPVAVMNVPSTEPPNGPTPMAVVPVPNISTLVFPADRRQQISLDLSVLRDIPVDGFTWLHIWLETNGATSPIYFLEKDDDQCPELPLVRITQHNTPITFNIAKRELIDIPNDHELRQALSIQSQGQGSSTAVLNIRVDDILAELSAMGFDHFSIQCQLFHNATDPSQYAPLNPKGSAWNVGDYREVYKSSSPVEAQSMASPQESVNAGGQHRNDRYTTNDFILSDQLPVTDARGLIFF